MSLMASQLFWYHQFQEWYLKKFLISDLFFQDSNSDLTKIMSVLMNVISNLTCVIKELELAKKRLVELNCIIVQLA